jgi:hypothetical protein
MSGFPLNGRRHWQNILLLKGQSRKITLFESGYIAQAIIATWVAPHFFLNKIIKGAIFYF